MHSSIRNSVLTAVLFFSVGSGFAQDNPTVWDGVYSNEQAGRGEEVYTESCVACHGQDLGGNSNSPALIGMSFMFLWEGRSVGEFFEKIRSEMPTDRPGMLSDVDYLNVIAYILQQNTFPSGREELPLDRGELNTIDIASKN